QPDSLRLKQDTQIRAIVQTFHSTIIQYRGHYITVRPRLV
ncbi:hypothetical protein F441_21766, partial [Phytophthora nicotianae CJ01A1]